MTVAEFKKRKPSKYRNVKVVQDGETYDSKKEAQRGRELALMSRAGLIFKLQRQVVYPLIVNGELICRYIADFQYVEKGKTHVEDVKSTATRKIPAFVIKKRLMRAIEGIEIIEV